MLLVLGESSYNWDCSSKGDSCGRIKYYYWNLDWFWGDFNINSGYLGEELGETGLEGSDFTIELPLVAGWFEFCNDPYGDYSEQGKC